jgi:hypothetical protein
MGQYIKATWENVMGAFALCSSHTPTNKRGPEHSPPQPSNLIDGPVH